MPGAIDIVINLHTPEVLAFRPKWYESFLGDFASKRTFFHSAINQPNGICLVTGPTGSGKTTTLYSALNAANSPDVKINAVYARSSVV